MSGLRPRYLHYLTRPKRAVFPKRVVIVDCDSIPVDNKPDGKSYTEALFKWSAECLSHEDNEYRTVCQYSGPTSVAFHRTVLDLLISNGLTWIVSYQCSRIWALLDLWESIEKGIYSITGRNHRVSNHNALHGMRQ